MRQLTIVACLLCIAGSARADYWPQNDPRSGGMQDLMLLYLGGDRYTVDDLMPYVAYLDKKQDGKPLDWFYDSFLFLLGSSTSPSGKSANYLIGATDREDWERYLSILFASDGGMRHLDQAITRAGKTLGPPAQKVPIILMIPYPSDQQHNFGSVDVTGQTLDFRKPQDAGRAAGWLVAESARRFADQHFEHLSLWGYYWMYEGVSPPDVEKVKATARAVHDKKFGFSWIPCSGAQNRANWRDLGFDFAILQPNYAFMDMDKPGSRDVQRLPDTAAECRRYNVGIEIESWHPALTDGETRGNLIDYLNYGLPTQDGYMKALHGYYMQELLLPYLYRSDLPANNDLYHDLYLFHKGTYAGRDHSIARQQPCVTRLPGQSSALTLALTGDAPAPPAEAVQVPNGGEVIVNFPTELRVGEVRLHVRPGRGQPDAAFSVKASLRDNLDGAGPVLGETRTAGTLDASATARWVTVRGKPQQGRYLAIGLAGPADATLIVDQVRAFAPVGPATEAAYDTDGVGPGQVLTGRLYASGPDDVSKLVQWPAGRGTITLKGTPDRHFGTLRLHAVKPRGGQWPSRVTVACGGQTAVTDVPAPAEGWAAYLPVRVPIARVASAVTLTMEGAAQNQPIALDKLEVELADNLARGKPYNVDPLPSEAGAAPGQALPQYPDDGKKLTDGQLAELFNDGKLLGWLGVNPTVTVDLGQALPVDTIRVHAWGGGGADTYFPKSVTVSTSADGAQWQAAPKTISPPAEPPATKVFAKSWLETNLEAPAARYVKFEFVPHSFLLFDEIEIISNGRNVAQGRPYVAAAPPPQGPYADDGKKLTDGQTSVGMFNKSLVVGHYLADPTVTVDLQQAEDITLAAAHVCGGGVYDVCYPTEVGVQSSLDGITWSAPVTTTEHPHETGAGTVALMEVPLNTRARYVRWHFKRHGFCMVDEVEVYGK